MNKIDEIKERCDKRGFQTRLLTKQVTLFDDHSKEVKEDRQHLIVSIPEEREARNIIIIDGEELDTVYKSNFEKFKFIKGYEACWSEELKIIECELQADDAMPRASRHFLKPLFNAIKEKKDLIQIQDDKPILIFPSPKGNIKILIGDSSNEFSILSNFKRDMFFFEKRMHARTSIRIEGIEAKTHDEAKEILLKLGNSVLFQIDLNINIPLHLSIDRDLLRDLRRKRITASDVNFIAPKFEYDNETMSLYWYARTATNMPLLQFLAFYQILEFYFPTFSYTEAQQKIKNLIKNPLFDSNKDTDLAQIISIIKLSAKGKSIGDERTQLKATVHHVVDNSALIAFLTESPERKDFYDVSKKSKGLAKQRVSFANPDNDVRAEIANRIYEIRCRIVHTKDEDDMDLILPSSTELIHLKHDLELIEFLAKKTIIATSRPLKI